jgi:hypothetical protein
LLQPKGKKRARLTGAMRARDRRPPSSAGFHGAEVFELEDRSVLAFAQHQWLFLQAVDSVATVHRLVAFTSTNTTTGFRTWRSGDRRRTRYTSAPETRSRPTSGHARPSRATHAWRPIDRPPARRARPSTRPHDRRPNIVPTTGPRALTAPKEPDRVRFPRVEEQKHVRDQTRCLTNTPCRPEWRELAQQYRVSVKRAGQDANREDLLDRPSARADHPRCASASALCPARSRQHVAVKPSSSQTRRLPW